MKKVYLLFIFLLCLFEIYAQEGSLLDDEKTKSVIDEYYQQQKAMEILRDNERKYEPSFGNNNTEVSAVPDPCYMPFNECWCKDHPGNPNCPDNVSINQHATLLAIFGVVIGACTLKVKVSKLRLIIRKKH